MVQPKMTPKNLDDNRWQHPTGELPASVAILALGPSKHDFFEQHIPHDFAPPWDEVWTVNVGIRYPHDLAFVMDDLRKESTRYRTDRYGVELATHDRPLITSTAYPEFPNALAYPLDEVIAWWGGRWPSMPRSSIPAVLAYAGFIGVKRLFLFGVDYSPDGGRREAGATWVTWWLGRLLERGVEIAITESSMLLDTSARLRDPDYAAFYGWAIPPPAQV